MEKIQIVDLTSHFMHNNAAGKSHVRAVNIFAVGFKKVIEFLFFSFFLLKIYRDDSISSFPFHGKKKKKA